MWCGLGPEAGRVVSDQNAYEYAKEHLDDMPERDKQLFVAFFFSSSVWEKSGVTVSHQKAYEYAKAHLDDMPEEDKQLFVEFFFSGNWVKEEDCEGIEVSHA